MTTKTNPRYADQLHAEAGWALRRSAPSQKVLGIALGLSASRISRLCNGSPGVVQRFYDVVRSLTANRRTTPGHVIAGAILAAEERAVTADPDTVRAELAYALRRETEAQAAEDVAEYDVVEALERWMGSGGSDDAAALDSALVAHEQASLDEMGWHITAVVYGRALRVLMGRRVTP